MSNLLSIEIIESRTAGSNDPFEFSVIVSDSYGAVYDKGYPSMSALMEAHPTRMELLEWVAQKNEFADAIICTGTEVVLSAVSAIDFAGYPEDDSITAIKREDSVEQLRANSPS